MNESDKLEFKREVNDSLVKEVIAFCNSSGGTIVIGYNDDGSVYGVENVRKELDKVSSKLHDSIEPDISFLVSPRIEKQEGKDIIIVEVLQGTSKPYYLKNKGMTPEGVYIRLGATTQHATSEIIRQMIIETSGITFEKNISINQDLTFIYTERIFKEKGLAFGNREKKTLSIINDKDKYTNLGLLLSDQCPYTIKMAIYKDTTKNEFVDMKETAQRSVLQQLEEALNYLKLNNKISGKIENHDYPFEVLRESLLNTIGHRDYEIPGSTLVHIFTDRIEILSLGGLVKGLTIDDIKLGSSSSRNPKLMNILQYLCFENNIGSGISRILELYKNANKHPEIKTATHSFLIMLPILNINNKYEKIINYLKENETITRKKVENLLNIKKNASIDILNEMVAKDLLIKEGKSRDIVYKLQER